MADRSAEPFYQAAPKLENSYQGDALLQSFLKWKLPPPIFAEIEPGLKSLGERAAGPMMEVVSQAEAQPPRHIPYDAWGKRIDRIEVSQAWNELDRIAAEEGIVATGYERKHGEHSRLHQFARLYLYHPSSAIYSCPLAMTDGAARAIELYGDPELKSRAYRHLTSRDPATFWTSGQWMTERTGGSDVSGTSTIARREGDHYRLYGTKWFTSATTSQMAMTLARIEGAPEGSRGLSLFYLELRDSAGELNGITVHRLKDKLGTQALPTAELTLQGARAKLVGGEGGGVKKISSLFNITRLYNACCAVGDMRRGLALARDYAPKRTAFGKPLSEQPLHLETLADLSLELTAGFLLTFRAIELLGKEETAQATEAEKALLRALTPIAKLFTAKQSIATISEILESFGGAGYVEDTGLPRLLRDTQVLSIWEGTTNVLSLDLLRAIEKEKVLEPLLADLVSRINSLKTPELKTIAAQISSALKLLTASPLFQSAGAKPENADLLQASARHLAYALAKFYSASLLAEYADWCQTHEPRERAEAALEATKRWTLKHLAPEPAFAPATRMTAEHLKLSRYLALEF